MALATGELEFEKIRQERFAGICSEAEEKAQLGQSSEYLNLLQCHRALLELQRTPSSEILGPRANTYFRLMRLVTRQGAEQTRRDLLALRKDTRKRSSLEQLLRDPEKLNAALSLLRATIPQTAPGPKHE